MTIKQIIEEEMKRNPDTWKDVVASRIDYAYRKKGGTKVKEYSFSMIATQILITIVVVLIIAIGAYMLI